ncbi:DegT/DnrJ/EryC1/StrS family aminotransferase [Amylibacter sp.]|nr:DegT/DnrJ/EryC1/StrS family aminotransferase [Amylibacter sp.]MDB4095639.1 DegT/DnrJ/EryC1/StrS family aminotransferase [Amylibacter sp.]
MYSNINPNYFIVNGSIRDANKKINKNGYSSIVLVSSSGKFQKVISDGDIRRYLASGGDLYDACSKVRVPNNQQKFSEPLDIQRAKATFDLNENIKLLPIVDDNEQLINVVSKEDLSETISISIPYLDKKDLLNCQSALADNWISSKGKFINEFENNLSHTLGGHVLCVSNGTVAIELALKSLALNAGARVGVPDFTFAASINAILNVGATPVILPVDRKTWKINASRYELEKENLDGIILVNIYGLQYSSGEIEMYKGICTKVILDSAEALEPNIFTNKEHVDAITYSFFANKILTTGEGGAVGFSSKNNFEEALIIRDHGMCLEKRYWHTHIGSNYRMTNLQAALGCDQILRLKDILATRREIFIQYNHAFNSENCPNIIIDNMQNEVSPWLYSVQFQDDIDIEHVINYMMNNLIECRPVFYSLSSMNIYKNYTAQTCRAGFEQIIGISLPTYIGLENDQIQKITSTLVRYFRA